MDLQCRVSPSITSISAVLDSTGKGQSSLKIILSLSLQNCDISFKDRHANPNSLYDDAALTEQSLLNLAREF